MKEKEATSSSSSPVSCKDIDDEQYPHAVESMESRLHQACLVSDAGIEHVFSVLNGLLSEYEESVHGSEKWQKLLSFLRKSLQGPVFVHAKVMIDRVSAEKTEVLQKQLEASEKFKKVYKKHYEDAICDLEKVSDHYKSRITDLESNCRVLEERYSGSLAILETAKQESLEWQKKYEETFTEKKAVENQVKVDANFLKSGSRETEARLAAAHEQAQLARNEATEWKAKHDVAVNEATEWKAKHDVAVNKATEWKEKHDVAVNQASEWKQKHDVAVNEATKWKEKHDDAFNEVTEWKGKHDVAYYEVSEWKEKHDIAANEASEWKEKHDFAVNEASKWKEKHDVAVNEATQWKEKHGVANNEASAWKEKNDAAVNEASEWKEKHDAAVNEASEWKEKHDVAVTEATEWKEKINVAVNEATQWKEKHGVANNEASEWKEKHDVAVNEAKAAMEKAAILKQCQVKDTKYREEASMAKFSKCLAEKDIEMKEKAVKLDNAEQRLNALMIELKTMKEEAQGLFHEKQHLEEKYQTAIKRFEEAHQQYKATEDQIKVVKEFAEKSEAGLLTVQNAFNDAQQLAIERLTQIESAQRRNEMLERERTVLANKAERSRESEFNAISKATLLEATVKEREQEIQSLKAKFQQNISSIQVLKNSLDSEPATHALEKMMGKAYSLPLQTPSDKTDSLNMESYSDHLNQSTPLPYRTTTLMGKGFSIPLPTPSDKTIVHGKRPRLEFPSVGFHLGQHVEIDKEKGMEIEKAESNMLLQQYTAGEDGNFIVKSNVEGSEDVPVDCTKLTVVKLRQELNKHGFTAELLKLKSPKKKDILDLYKKLVLRK